MTTLSKAKVKFYTLEVRGNTCTMIYTDPASGERIDRAKCELLESPAREKIIHALTQWVEICNLCWEDGNMSRAMEDVIGQIAGAGKWGHA